jgi:hypothetical protein
MRWSSLICVLCLEMWYGIALMLQPSRFCLAIKSGTDAFSLEACLENDFLLEGYHPTGGLSKQKVFTCSKWRGTL